MLSIFNIRSGLWIAFFAAIVVAWVIMFMMANMSGVDLTGRPVGMNVMPMVTFGALFPMWAIMMAAMMLPTLVPTLRSYEDLMTSANGSRAGWSGVLLGYFIVWVGFAAVIAAVQVALIALGAIDALGIASSVWIAAGLLVVVGLFQFSRTKEICHGVCHAPMMYFVGHWKVGFRGGLRMGLGLGAFCVGCCWGFMALGFVGGVMSLLWMGLATLFMILEKLPAVGHIITKPMGVALILAGIALPIWAHL
jgi:predicted metal-binding membrane protein